MAARRETRLAGRGIQDLSDLVERQGDRIKLLKGSLDQIIEVFIILDAQ